MTTYRTVESHTYPHTHDHRTPDPCNHCGATRKWVVPTEIPDGDLYVFDATKGDEHYDRLDLVALVDSGVLMKMERGNDDCPEPNPGNYTRSPMWDVKDRGNP